MSGEPTTTTTVVDQPLPSTPRTMASIAEMREVCQLRRPNAKGKMVWAGHWFNSMCTRHISIYFTWLFVRLGISANATTFLMIPTGLLGVALLIPHVLWANLLGCALLLLAVILDCVDGEIARWTKKSSIRGFCLDYVYHVLCNPPVYALCALHLYAWRGETLYLILAFVTYVAANSAQMLAMVFRLSLVMVPPPSSPASTSERTASGGPLTALRKAAKLLFFDQFITEAVIMAAILLTYLGVTGPILFLAWAIAGARILFSVSQTTYRYFYTLPEAGHHKSV